MGIFRFYFQDFLHDSKADSSKADIVKEKSSVASLAKAKSNNANFASAKSTHPQTPSAREVAFRTFATLSNEGAFNPSSKSSLRASNASVAIYNSSKVDCHALDSAKMQNLIVLQSQQNHKNLITMQLNFPS